MVSNNPRFSNVEEAVLKTLIYSDIFHFPLTRDEIWRFLIIDKKITKKACYEAISSLKDHIITQDGFYCLQGREAIITQRKQNLSEVQKKLRLAKRTVFYLSHIPTILFIGISGGLALGSATKEDDIDLFIITKKNTLFMTRLWILLLLEWKNLRRKRGEESAPDKICVNLLLDEGHLAFSSRKRDIYIAHEIVQVQPLFERNDTYQMFMNSNSWVKRYLPHSLEERLLFHEVYWKANYYVLNLISKIIFHSFFEQLVQRLQQRYMKNHQTIEQVSKGVLALHPIDYRAKTLKDLRLKCEKLGLLTKF
jgi:hypothetical protein